MSKKEITFSEVQFNNSFNYYLHIGSYLERENCLIYESNKKLKESEFDKLKNSIKKSINLYHEILTKNISDYINNFTEFDFPNISSVQYKFNIDDKVLFYRSFIREGYIKERYIKNNKIYYKIISNDIYDNIEETKIINFIDKHTIKYNTYIIYNNRLGKIDSMSCQIEDNKLFYNIKMLDDEIRIYLNRDLFEIVNYIDYSNRNDKYIRYNKTKEYGYIQHYIEKAGKYLIKIYEGNIVVSENEFELLNIEPDESGKIKNNDFVQIKQDGRITYNSRFGIVKCTSCQCCDSYYTKVHVDLGFTDYHFNKDYLIKLNYISK